MSENNAFKVTLKTPVCLNGFSEDDLRDLVNSLTVSLSDDGKAFVLTTAGTQVCYNFGPDGNFNSVTATLNGESVILIHGVGSQVLGTFIGPPSSTNPGAGWKLETELTLKFFGQPTDETQWEIFYASRAPVLNTLV